MKKFINHFKQWNIWRKRSTDGPIHKLLVLFKIVHSPTFYNVPVFEYTVPETVEPKEEANNIEVTERETLDKFMEVMRLSTIDVLFWVPNIDGPNTIKLRLKDNSDLIFSCVSPTCWALETAESYYKKGVSRNG